jgi:hypothetical protein
MEKRGKYESHVFRLHGDYSDNRFRGTGLRSRNAAAKASVQGRRIPTMPAIHSVGTPGKSLHDGELREAQPALPRAVPLRSNVNLVKNRLRAYMLGIRSCCSNFCYRAVSAVDDIPPSKS